MLARPSEQRYRQMDRHGQERTTVRYHRANRFTNGGNTDTLRKNTYYIVYPVTYIPNCALINRTFIDNYIRAVYHKLCGND